MIELGHPKISVKRQCELIGLARSSAYYAPLGESAENLALMRLIDELYTLHPFYGVRQSTRRRRQRKHRVNFKRGSGNTQCMYQENRGVSSRSFSLMSGNWSVSSGNMSYHFCVT